MMFKQCFEELSSLNISDRFKYMQEIKNYYITFQKTILHFYLRILDFEEKLK